MIKSTTLLISLTFAGLAAAGDAVQSPHARAIELVIGTLGEGIAALDESSEWMSDTKERSWSARRPFAPGSFDSTHLFEVTYRIDGQVVGMWKVNTQNGTIAKAGTSIKTQ